MATRPALQSLGFVLATVLVMSTSVSGAENAPDTAAELSLQEAGDRSVTLTWKDVSGYALELGPPVLTALDGDSSVGLPVEIRPVSQTCADGRAEFRYALSIDERGRKRDGTYRMTYTLAREGKRTVLRRESDLEFEEPLRLVVSVEHTARVLGKQPTQCTLPLRNGVVTDFALGGPQAQAAYFALGRGATSSRGQELAVPVVGLRFDGDAQSSLAVATDPYCGVQFRLQCGGDEPQRQASITAATTYQGTLVPVTRETRTCVFAFHPCGIDGMLTSFYDTIPEILPGAPWIHDVQLNYFDYLGKQGRAWFADLEKLAEKIPAEKRKAVVVNLHGWYDYLGRYAFDRNSRKLEDEWIAFPRTRKIAMSKAEIHRRIRFAKDLGFRAVLYFADGLNADSGMPDFPEQWIFKDEHGNARKGWTGPSTGVTYAMDPSNPEVRRFFLDYAEAVLDEYGGLVDGFAWDETQYIAQERLSSTGGGLAYADRDFMTLVVEITQRVQRRRSENPNLVFLTSDCVGCWGDHHVPYALVSHGTYQDTACNPVAWPPGLLPNYRNCLWSCNWSPLTNRDWNRIAAEEYGLPQGLSCGFGDDVGPAEMPEEILDEVIGRFLKRAEEGGRTRFLTEPTVHVVVNRYGCTSQEDAAGGCDALKTGTWGFCTEREANPWWQVDLGRSLPLDRVVIYNRCDAKMEVRAARLKVLLSQDGNHWTEAYQHDGTPFFGHTDGKPLKVPLDRAAARFVRIQLPSTEYLHLDEVEVYGPESPTNLALLRPADQSSVSQWSTPGPAEPLKRK